MKCPACEHTPAPGETEDPTRCPNCGIFYHKSLARALNESEIKRSEAEARAAQARFEEKNTKSEVIVTDFRMTFWAMVWFMVKWAIAAIPAVVILIAIVSFSLGLVGSFTRYFR